MVASAVPRELEVMRMEENFDGIWSYERSDRIPGAFRVISVSHLLDTPPSIRLYEWHNENQMVNSNDSDNPKVRYAAISHVWKSSQAVKDLCRDIKRPIKIKKPGDPHEINWQGLCQAASAAEGFDCQYIWLDLLCIDQIKRPKGANDHDKEKNIQVKNMGRIYEGAAAVLVMVAE
jgi:hypothetical protein